MELFDLSGRVAIVTGGGSGLGRQLALALAQAGAAVVVCGRKLQRCEAVAAELSELGVPSLALRCDVTQQSDVETLIRTTVDELGAVDVLVNNAGTTWGAPAAAHPLDAWQKVLAVNLTGTFLCSQVAAREMLGQGHGKIVNIASIAGLRGADPTIRQAAAYSASKGGVLALTRDLACEWAHRGVYVNAIAPGTFPTDIMEHTLAHAGERIRDSIPMHRFGRPGDLSGAVIFLSSAASDFVTGQTLVVDGGRTSW